jgi:hypothetical protein
MSNDHFEIEHWLLGIGQFVILAACCPLLQLAAQADPAFPAGWHVRTDKNKPTTEVRFVRMGRGLHVTLGPAVVLWRDTDLVTGRYSVSATFTQTKNPRHAEGYGLIIGGRRLIDARNRYTYFLVRGDGTFLVKRRIVGDSTVEVTDGWTPSDAVVKADSAGQATNELSIVVTGREVTFHANGKEVYRARAADLDTQGLVGYRVNHNLDVHLGALVVRKR